MDNPTTNNPTNGVRPCSSQDRTCPAHYEDGEPHTWFGTWLIDWRHFPELFLYVPDSSIQQYKSWVEAIFRRVLKGNVELINEIFE